MRTVAVVALAGMAAAPVACSSSGDEAPAPVDSGSAGDAATGGDPGAGGSARGGAMNGAGGAANADGRSVEDGGPPDGSVGMDGCPPLPAFPDANCTGYRHTGVTLSPYAGPTTITARDTVIDSKDVSGCLRIEANGVVIRRSRVRCAGGRESETTFGVAVADGVTGLVIEDTEIASTTIPTNCLVGDPPLLTRPAYLGPGNGARLTRVHAHHTRSGINLGNNVVIEDSLLETNCNPDPHGGSGADWQHSTALGALGGTAHIVLRHNSLDNGAANASSSISFYPETAFGGPNDDVKIDGNLINADAYYCAYFGYTPPDEKPNTRFVITNNVWGTKYNADCGMSAPVVYAHFDPASFDAPYPGGWGGVWSGNTWRNGKPYELSDL